MRTTRLTREEREIEENIEKFVPVEKKEFEDIVRALEARKKDAVLNIRVSKYDLDSIKKKATQLGVRYQTFISEVLHKVAQAS